MHLFHFPQWTIQNGHVPISTLSGTLRDIEQVDYGICEVGLLHIDVIASMGIVKLARSSVTIHAPNAMRILINLVSDGNSNNHIEFYHRRWRAWTFNIRPYMTMSSCGTGDKFQKFVKFIAKYFRFHLCSYIRQMSSCKKGTTVSR